MKKHYMIIDVSLCFDCNDCFMACKDEHNGNKWLPYTDEQPLHGHRWMNIERKERGQYPRVEASFLPMPCQHCQDAPCAKAFPELIKVREDGIVLIDAEKAKGNKDLVESCPYGAIYWSEESNIAQKCTMCAHILDNENCDIGMPRCAHSCPTNAITHYEMEEAEMAIKIKEDGLEVYHPEYGSKPNVLYKNLYRFTKAFIAGGLLKDNDCAEGVEVNLKGKDVNVTVTTDYFGDFKFDDLLPGEYTVRINGEEIKTVVIKESLNIGRFEI